MNMKPFIIWIVITLLVFGTSSAAYHLYLEKSPRKILVAVDSSFSMKEVWNQVPQTLRTLEGQRYVTYSLVTEKNKIHSWSPELKLGTIVPYAPRDFSKLIGNAKYPEVEEAQQKYLITDPDGAQSNNFRGWTVISLTP
jgi:hypothetical protein